MTARRRYAKESDVLPRKTRGEIQALLERWGCRKIAFLDHYDEQRVEVQFVWRDDADRAYAARFELDVRPRVVQADGTKLLSERAADREIRGRWRTLLYWLRGAIDAVDAGIIPPELVFLPWMVQADGRTAAEVLLPKLRALPSGVEVLRLPGEDA